jgi:hypothetical protein
LGVILVVHAAFATLLAMAPRWEGTLSQHVCCVLVLSGPADVARGSRSS